MHPRTGELSSRVSTHMPAPCMTSTPFWTSHAWSANDEADFAIWLLDAAQPLKQTELAILTRAADARLPVQLLVNKADRLSPDDLAKVMDALAASLAETGLVSHAPPIALSARLAL